MELTLFGVIESKSEAKKRAERIVLLMGRIEDAPADRRAIRTAYKFAAYIIKRAKAKKLGPDDLDGLQRNIGDLSGLLTDDDCDEMQANRKLWKRYPKGWPGWQLPNAFYCCTLHKKEIAYLEEEVRDDAISEMLALRKALKDYRRELATLRAVTDLPDEIAKRYNLTPQGERLKK